ncbi:unnamed protein product [Pleuronectes platessa]|uniref:Uncharacterized protein n=1 Tax=Pleuronectes platessa TaxID=8262 RepID=A0A9N7UFQ7_PLEPL|nr:unnamed protein product [Pleuronectes platessa]
MYGARGADVGGWVFPGRSYIRHDGVALKAVALSGEAEKLKPAQSHCQTGTEAETHRHLLHLLSLEAWSLQDDHLVLDEPVRRGIFCGKSLF